MKPIFRSILVYFELLLLIGYSITSSAAIVDNYGSVNQKRDLVLIQGFFYSDSIAIKENNSVFQKRKQHFNSDHLFLINHPITTNHLEFTAQQKVKVLDTYRTPDYLLSSDLKSPPQGC